MSFITGLLVGLTIGSIIGFMMAIAAASLASQDSEKGEASSDFIVAVAFYLLLALIVLGLWLLSGWELPL